MKIPLESLRPHPFHVIWMVDCSEATASNGKMQLLNNAIREAIPHMQMFAEENPNLDVFVGAVKFAQLAEWHVALAHPYRVVRLAQLCGDGGSRAPRETLDGVADRLTTPPMSNRSVPPVLVLISNGNFSDDFVGNLRNLAEQPLGRKALRLTIAIGEANLDSLNQFTGNPEIRPIPTHSIDLLRLYVGFQIGDWLEGRLH